MATKYVLTTSMTTVPVTQHLDSETPVAEALTPQEFTKMAWGSKTMHDELQAISRSESTFIDLYPDYMIGSFAVPDKHNPLGDPTCFAFYLDRLHLIFIDESGLCENLLEVVARSGVMKQMTTPHCLYEFIKQLIKDDLDYLAGLEDRMEDVEEAILGRCEKTDNRQMLHFRRLLLRIDGYYQQLADMASVIAENESKILSHEESRLFSLLSKQSERLLQRSQTLKEYSLQLRELYQANIDIQQNDTIQWFTVVTTLFAPLTLLTGWFGMNFEHMPGLDWPGSYFIVIGVSLAITVGMLAFFRKKGWI